MENKAILIINESDLINLIKSGSLNCEYKLKILPDDSPLANDEVYRQLKKEYRKAMEKMNKYSFDKLTNK